MKGRTIILDHMMSVEAAALMVDGKLSDILVAGDAPAPGYDLPRDRGSSRQRAGRYVPENP